MMGGTGHWTLPLKTTNRTKRDTGDMKTIPSFRWIAGVFGSLVLCSLLRQAGSLAVAPSSTKSQPIRRVAIIGTGIAGLAIAHALENSPELSKRAPGSVIEVSLFDSRPSLDFEAGAGVQLNGGTRGL